VKSTRPLAQSGNEIERLLLAAGAGERPADESVRRAAAILGVAPRAAILASVLGATRATRWTSLATWASAGILGIAGAGALVVAMRATPPSPPPSARPHGVEVSGPSQAPPPAALVPSTGLVPVAATAPAAIPVAEPLVAAPARRAASEPAPHGLREQAEALDAARALLAAGDSRGTLVRLGDFDRRFAGGPLREEASLLRIEALARTGDRAAASAAARRFLRAYPGSVQADRVADIARQMQGDGAP
jgi:hypothetical protein